MVRQATAGGTQQLSIGSAVVVLFTFLVSAEPLTKYVGEALCGPADAAEAVLNTDATRLSFPLETPKAAAAEKLVLLTSS